MIIFCAGLRSSASTLQWQIAKDIVVENNLGLRFIVNNKNLIDNYLHTNKLVVVKQHKLTHADYINKSDALVLMTVRDLRDVQCSLVQRWHKSFAHCFEKLTHYVDEQQEWIDRVYNKVYLVTYEQFVQNIESEIQQIGYQLNIDLNYNTISKIAEKHSIENNKKRLKLNHIADAQIGKYKTLLTKMQIKTIEDGFEYWLKSYGYS